jgi:hypothetical protein
MPGGTRLTIRPSRVGYVTGGVVLLLVAIMLAIVPRVVRGPAEAALATVVIGGIALYGLNDLLVAIVARIVVDDDGIQMRNQLGLQRRFERADIGGVARRSVFAPAQSGIYEEELLLIAKDGRCLARIWEADYGSADLHRLVNGLRLEWPQTERSSVRHVNRTFPGAHRLDFQIAAVVVLVVITVGLGVITFALLTH